MSKPNHNYVVTAYRQGDRENHSYVLGVYTTKTKAVKAAEAEEAHRSGNKYICEVLEVLVDSPERMNHKAVKALEQMK